MSQFKDKSRRLARERYWSKHNRDSYRCPDCGRREEETATGFEVHHQGGDAYDNRLENLVALCNLCHCIREGRKPPMKEIKALRDNDDNDDDEEESLDIPRSVRSFIGDRVREPADPPYVDVLAVWMTEFRRYCKFSDRFNREDAGPVDLLRGLEEIAGAEVEYNHEYMGVEVWGVEHT